MSMFCSLDEPNTAASSTTLANQPAETNSSRELKIFKKVIRDPVLRAPFQEFLEQQFCAENLNFYLAVEQFKEISEFQERATFGRRIYDRYFAMNSTEPVNIDNSTSKRIRETVDSGTFPLGTFDVAQYQILHLLKYDCWPRFLRSTSNTQPTFTDEELAAEDEEKHSLSQPTSLNNASEFEQSAQQSSSQPNAGSGLSGASTITASSTPQTNPPIVVSKEKRKSILWHGLDRFSRRLRRGDSNVPTSSSGGPDDGGDCAGPPQGGRGVVGSAGSKRRYIFAASKQHSMPAEMTSPVKKNSLSPTHLRRRPVEAKKCQLMVGDQFNTETVILDDPTMSVRRWTQEMAEAQGMDKLQTEVVDAETGSTIDPARQAIDALQSRALRLVPVVSFIIEFLPPNFSFKNPSTTPTKLICVRARQSLSTNAVLRALLAKYTPDPNTAKVVLNGSLEQIKRSVSVGMMAQKCLTVLTDSQYTDRVNAGKPCLSTPRDPILLQQPSLIYEQNNFQFHQHGDISYCEIPTEAERNKHSHQHHNEVQNSTHQQKEYTLSIFNKFVRKASHAVSKNEPASTAATSTNANLTNLEHKTGASPNTHRSIANNNVSNSFPSNSSNINKSMATASTSNNNGDSNKNRASVVKNKPDIKSSAKTDPESLQIKEKLDENIIPHRSNGGNSNKIMSPPVATTSANKNTPLPSSTDRSEGTQCSEATSSVANIRHPAIFSTKIGNASSSSAATTSTNTLDEYPDKPLTPNMDLAERMSTSLITCSSPPKPKPSPKPMEVVSSSTNEKLEKESTWQPAAYV